MRNLKSLLLAVFMVACTVGTESADPAQEGGVRYVDTNGDGVSDGVDTDGDGDVDEAFQSPNASLPPGGVPVCLDPLVDSNNDGIWDGLDLDCDGDIDIPFDLGGGGGGGGGGGNVNQCNVTIVNNNDKKQVSCTNGQCECRANDVLTKTCTDTGSSCSFPGNCCGF